MPNQIQVILTDSERCALRGVLELQKTLGWEAASISASPVELNEASWRVYFAGVIAGLMDGSCMLVESEDAAELVALVSQQGKECREIVEEATKTLAELLAGDYKEVNPGDTPSKAIESAQENVVGMDAEAAVCESLARQLTAEPRAIATFRACDRRPVGRKVAARREAIGSAA